MSGKKGQRPEQSSQGWLKYLKLGGGPNPPEGQKVREDKISANAWEYASSQQPGQAAPQTKVCGTCQAQNGVKNAVCVSCGTWFPAVNLADIDEDDTEEQELPLCAESECTTKVPYAGRLYCDEHSG